jgi:ankyrin repeat protein
MASWADLYAVRELIKHGASVNETTRVGNTSLHLASRDGHFSIVQELINHCDLSINNRGQTVLDIAGTDEIKQFISDYELFSHVKEPDCN